MKESSHWAMTTRTGAIVNDEGRHEGWQDYMTVRVHRWMALEIAETIVRQVKMDMYDVESDDYINFTIAGKLTMIKDED